MRTCPKCKGNFNTKSFEQVVAYITHLEAHLEEKTPKGVI